MRSDLTQCICDTATATFTVEHNVFNTLKHFRSYTNHKYYPDIESWFKNCVSKM